MEISDKDWQMLIDVTSRDFDEDIVMDCILKLVEALERGPVENPLAWMRTACGHRERDLREKRDGITEIPMSAIQEAEEQGYSLPQALHDTRDPFEIVAAKQEIEIIEKDYPELIEQMLANEEEELDFSERTYFRRKAEAWKERERRAV